MSNLSAVRLRPHQAECIAVMRAYEGRYAVAEITVAGGKSLIMACLAGYTEGRALILAHNEELVRHIVKACREVGIRPGVCSGKMGRNVFAQVTVGTVQTVVRRLRSFKDVKKVLVDEGHRIPVNKTSSYRKVFKEIPHAQVQTLTATPFRADGTGSLEKTFGPIIYRYTFIDALRDGYVKPLIPAYSDEAFEISTEGLKTVRTDGQDEFDLQEMATRAIQLAKPHVRSVVDVMAKQGRRRVLGFACSTEHADRLEAEFLLAGARAASVHSRSPNGKRERCVREFERGELLVLISVGMFDTGFDVPDIDLLVFFRATKSNVFFGQALGRGARLTPYAENCAVLDFGGNVNRHGSIDALAAAPGVQLKCEACTTQWETWERGRTCPSCGTLHKTATTCKACNDKFDQFYHGGTCPHCGTIQANMRKCNACEETYAAFLHPLCPHCGYDNTSVREVGKDLSEIGGDVEVLNTSDILRKEPWQGVTRAPFRSNAGKWHVPTRYALVKWPREVLPNGITHLYLTKAGNGHIVPKGWMDASGTVHQL